MFESCHTAWPRGSTAISDQNFGREVVVTDIRMPFGSMIFFMVKWAVAAIQAIIILTVLIAICWVMVIAEIR